MSAYAHSRSSARQRPDESDLNLASPAIAPRALVVGSRLRLVVLAAGLKECAAVDRATGAFVWLEFEGLEQPQLQRYDVVSAELRVDDDIPDPARPEAARLAGQPQVVGKLRGRRARRFIDSLVLPPSRKQLLGFPGPSTTYWTISGTEPSLALIRLEKSSQFALQDDGLTRARFLWGGAVHHLPVSDPYLLDALVSSGRSRLTGQDLDKALGFSPKYLLVALTPPKDGHCYKTVGAALPRP